MTGGDAGSAAPAGLTTGLSTIVLAGGLGTRLRPVLPHTPKVIAPVAGTPFAVHLLRWLAVQGCRHVVLALGWQAGDVADLLLPEAERLGLIIDISRESQPLGTGGAVRRALPLTRSNPVLVVNGDSLVGIELDHLVRCYQQADATGCLTLVRVGDTGRFGRVDCDESQRITAFREKGIKGEGLINAGVYLLSRDLLMRLPEGQACSLEQDLLARASSLLGVETTGPFLDIGTPESFGEAEAFIRIFPGVGA